LVRREKVIGWQGRKTGEVWGSQMRKYKKTVLLLIMTSFLTACNSDSRETVETNQSKTEDFILTDTGKDFLEDMCLCLPDFSDRDSLDEEFWHDFLFCSYTSPYREDIDFVMVWRDGLGFEEQEAKIPKEEFVSYVKLALGIDLPDFEPFFEDMGPTQTACYYQDGYYYVGASDFPAFTFTYDECRVLDDGNYEVEFAVELETEPDGGIVFTVEQAENENGFVILKKVRKR